MRGALAQWGLLCQKKERYKERKKEKYISVEDKTRQDCLTLKMETLQSYTSH
jgi:hypothetical protein